ncbi:MULTISPECIES: hypothetical protein [Halobacterium]|uniref:Uncharacterized protein n=4 Tax=Halobacterium salinarum TaxID=2242 RepID=Q9HML3_HALSA|nr:MULTISPECIES: hypothetical protein [Halobacterium]AAG20558.1 hypothetical protein VNG_2490H [Halobacterium salinarum NRC-1]MBB6089509.1 hypothetical protein [Halobacterium salinarum]MCF2164259.1 hypothetical protein [Halobacterium salinarum]MCF2167046.1 hypothetical protein [Halobacterium salinarum]MCF2207242.1 hypothetical protein [Halobacterium salinarum]
MSDSRDPPPSDYQEPTSTAHAAGGVYGETWVYESIVGAIPGIDISDRLAVLIQFVLFEVGVLVTAAVYDLPGAILPGTAAVLVAAAGSAFMLDIGARARGPGVPARYRQLLFASSIEVVLGVVSYVLLMTYLFVWDPRDGATLVAGLLGEQPPVIPSALALLVLWDVCYRIGTGWWAAVVALWRSLTQSLQPATASRMAGVDKRTLGFGTAQAVLLPFVWGHPLLVFAVAGHVVAVIVVTTVSLSVLRN